MYRLGAWLFRFRYVLPALVFTGVVLTAHPAWQGMAIGTPLIMAGEALRLWSARHCGRSSRTLAVPAPPRLVTSGPFAFVRNPIYLANILMYIGISVLFCPDRFWVHPAVLGLFVIQYAIIIRYEEARLAEIFGDPYRQYALEARRFVPRLTRITDEPAPFTFKAAMRSERGTLLMIALVTLIYIAVLFSQTGKS